MTGFEKPSNTCKTGLMLHIVFIQLFNILLHNNKTKKLDLSKQTTVTFIKVGFFFIYFKVRFI